MEIYAHEIEPGVFVRWPSGKPVFKTCRTSNLVRADGSVREVEDGPYEAEIRGLGADLHTFSDAELADMKIYPAEAFTPPSGKHCVGGSETFVRTGKTVRQVYDIVDIPPAPPPRTPAQKLAAAGLTPEEFDELVAASAARKGKTK